MKPSFLLPRYSGLQSDNLLAFNSDFVACKDARNSLVTQDALFAIFHLYGHIIDPGFFDFFLDLVAGKRATDQAGYGCQIAPRALAHLIAKQPASHASD